MQPDRTSEDHNQQNGGGSKRKPASVGANIAGLNPADEQTETLGKTPCRCAGAAHNAAVNQTAKEEATKHEQRSNDNGAIDLVNVELVFYKAVKSRETTGNRRSGARLPVIEDVSDVEADRGNQNGDNREPELKAAAACSRSSLCGSGTSENR